MLMKHYRQLRIKFCNNSNECIDENDDVSINVFD